MRMDEGGLLLLSGGVFLTGVVLLLAGPGDLARWLGVALVLVAFVPLVLTRPFS